MGWGTGSYGKQQTIAIQIVPKGKYSKISLNVPNSSSTSKTATPVAFVARMADSLKLGDTVKIGYSSLSGQTWMTSVTRSGGASKSKSKSAGVDQTASDAFVFVASRKVRTAAGMGVIVMARKGSNMWTFQLPAEATDTKAKPQPYSRSTETSDSDSKQPGSLSEQAAAFSPGDIVALGYKTVDYKFVLDSIRPYQMSDTGRLVRVGKRSVRGVIHDAAFVKTTANQSLSLLVPTTTSAGSKTEAAALAETLKTLKIGQPVDISYRKQKGVLWLDEITTAAAEVTAKRTK